MKRVVSLPVIVQRKPPFDRRRRCVFWSILRVLLLCVVTATAFAQPHRQVFHLSSEPMSIEELRWCRDEVLRLAGEAKEVDQNKYWEIHDYNENVDQYRSRCLNRSSSTEATPRLTNELTSTAKQGMREAGVRRFAFKRVHRSENQIFVKSKRINVFESSRRDAATVADLRQWEEAFLLGVTEANRVKIEWLTGIPQTRQTGWISESSYALGNGRMARETYCRANRGEPIRDDELMHGELSRERFMLLQIHNSTPQDAFVKLLSPERNVIVSFIVKAHSNRTINGLPQGEYEVAYATGFEFSRGCGSFVQRGFNGRVSQPIIFDDHNYEWEISLQIPSGEITTKDIRAYVEFESL